MGYDIRFSKESDLEACVSLSKASWPEWWSRNERLGRLHIQNRIKEERVLQATVQCETVAYFVFGMLWNKIHLEDLYVKEEHRKQGLASTLLQKILDIAREKGFKEVVSDCDANNKISYNWHIKNGFTECGYIKNNWDAEDSYVFVKKL
jgi:ribosomal protein S18 acetylase RimI-like enzyme